MVAFADIEALLGEQDATEVVQEAAKTSVALSGFTQDQMSKGKTKTPLVSILPTAGWEEGELGSDTRRKNIASWAAEAKYMTARPLSLVIPLPEEAIEDEDYDIWAAMRPGIATAFAQKIDLATFFGVGKPAAWTDPALIPAAIAAGNFIAADGADAGDIAKQLSDAMGLVEADGYDVSAVVARRTLRAQLRGLRDDNGAPIYTGSIASTPQDMGMIYGAPYLKMANGAWDNTVATALVGDFSYAHLGVRKQMSFKVLDQATLQNDSVTIHLGQEDALALRVTMRVAYAVFDPVNPEATDGYPFAAIVPTTPAA